MLKKKKRSFPVEQPIQATPLESCLSTPLIHHITAHHSASQHITALLIHTSHSAAVTDRAYTTTLNIQYCCFYRPFQNKVSTKKLVFFKNYFLNRGLCWMNSAGKSRECDYFVLPILGNPAQFFNVENSVHVDDRKFSGDCSLLAVTH